METSFLKQIKKPNNYTELLLVSSYNCLVLSLLGCFCHSLRLVKITLSTLYRQVKAEISDFFL